MQIGLWEVLTEAVIPGLGVLASTAVAVAALVVSRRAVTIARAAHRAGEFRDGLDERRRFAEAAIAYANEAFTGVVLSGQVPRPTELNLHAASISDPTATDIVRWITTGFVRIGKIPSPVSRIASKDPRRSNAARELIRELETRSAEWIAGGSFDMSRLVQEALMPAAPSPRATTAPSPVTPVSASAKPTTPPT